MSKIDDFNTAKWKSDHMAEFAKRIMQTYSRSGNGFYSDKFGATIKLEETHVGEYGSSSVYSWSDLIEKEVIRQIGIELRQIVCHAAERVARETEEIRKSAIEEAKAVLVEINP